MNELHKPEHKNELTSDEVRLPASRKIYVETNGVSSPHVSKGSASSTHEGDGRNA